MDKIKKGFEDIGVEPFIRFSIKAVDTEENNAVHNSFREFCKVECDNSYTLGLRKLLEYYQHDFKIEMMWEAIKDVQNKVLVLEDNKDKKDKTEQTDMF